MEPNKQVRTRPWKGKVVEKRIEGVIYLFLEMPVKKLGDAKISFSLETINGFFSPYLGKIVEITIKEVKE